jgi:3-hydroxyacyl-[acyl-carrier-protein] dehydratase
MPTPRPQTLELVKELLRRDLMLGAGTPIPDDMPFFGGDLDLDSLDILLLMTSIEKQFKIKVPSEAVGKQVFQNVTTLATYIEQSAGQAVPGPAAGSSAAPVDYLARLPHGPSFRFITSIEQIKPGESGQAIWSLKGDEPLFAGHFPGNPIVPGVLIAEALAQLCGLVGPETQSRSGKLAHIDIRFEQSVTPPAQIRLQASVLRVMGDLQQFEVAASVDGNQIAAGNLTLYRGEGGGQLSENVSVD